MNTFASLALALLGSSAMAAPGTTPAFDGSRNLLCALTQLQQCRADEGCKPAAFAETNLPQFLRFDFKAKTISGRRADGTLVSSPIVSRQSIGENLVLQGTEGEYGWSMSLSAGGELGLALTAPTFTALAFGACTDD